MYKFHKGKNKDETNFTNKNQHAMSSTNRKPSRNKLNEENTFHDEGSQFPSFRKRKIKMQQVPQKEIIMQQVS